MNEVKDSILASYEHYHWQVKNIAERAVGGRPAIAAAATTSDDDFHQEAYIVLGDGRVVGVGGDTPLAEFTSARQASDLGILLDGIKFDD